MLRHATLRCWYCCSVLFLSCDPSLRVRFQLAALDPLTGPDRWTPTFYTGPLCCAFCGPFPGQAPIQDGMPLEALVPSHVLTWP